eukprot:2912153-Pleurochrysis_carterae.AAC.1
MRLRFDKNVIGPAKRQNSVSLRESETIALTSRDAFLHALNPAAVLREPCAHVEHLGSPNKQGEADRLADDA